MNQVVVHGQYSKEDLLKMAGQMVGGNKNFIPQLYINRLVEDKETGEDLPIGVFTIDTKDKGRVYTKKKAPVTFRPYVFNYRYETYDSAADKTTGRSILFSDFRAEIYADNGLLKAGKNTPEKLKATEKCKCKVFLFGTVTLKGYTAKKEEVVIENQPCFVKFGGKGFIEVGDLFKEFTKANKLSFQYDMTLSPKHLKDAMYTIVAEWSDLTKENPITDDTIKTFETFIQYIEVENKRIENRFNAIVAKKAAPGEKEDPVVSDPNDSQAVEAALEDDLTDIDDE